MHRDSAQPAEIDFVFRCRPGNIRTNYNRNNMYEMDDSPSTSNTDRYETGGSDKRLNFDDIFRMETASDNSVLPGFVPKEQSTRFDDHVHWQHRTTSMHRNADVPNRTVPRNLEDRRKWMACTGTTTGRERLLDHAAKIVEFMQQDNLLMEDGPDSEQMRRDALRNMPQSLAVKKIIKRKLVASVNFGNKRNVSCEKMLKYRIAMWFSHINAGLKNMSYTFELWYDSLKKIEGNFGSAVSTYFKFLRWLFILNVFSTIICFGFIVVPQIIYEVDGKISKDEGNSTDLVGNGSMFSIADLFTGTGYLTDSLLYYGFYTNKSIGDSYNMPYAYFFTMIILYLAPFIILSVRMARSYNKSFIETKGGLKNAFAHKIFCGWDFSIANSKAADLKSTAIYHELQELLSDLDTYSERMSFMDRFRTRTLQIITNIFFVSVLGTIGYIMWILLDEHRITTDSEDSTLVELLTAIVINVIMVFLPMLFKLLARYEDYKNPRITLYISLFRTFLLEILVVGILIVFWLRHSENETCWETSLGQEIYRLIIFDFIFSLFVLELVQYFISKLCDVSQPEFDIATNTLSVIYNQTLFWLGFYFSPLLGIVVLIKLFLTWYIRSATLLRFCVPSSKSWRAAQTHTWFLILTFLSLLLLIGVHGYIMINVPVSKCGPFIDVQYIHEILNLENSGQFWKVLTYVRKPGVIALAIIGLSMFVFYVRAKSKAQIDMVAFLRNRLVLAAKDKEFLLKNITSITNGKWSCDLQEGRDAVVDPRKYAPSDFVTKKQHDYGDVMPSLSSDELLTTSTTSFPTSDTDLIKELY